MQNVTERTNEINSSFNIKLPDFHLGEFNRAWRIRKCSLAVAVSFYWLSLHYKTVHDCLRQLKLGEGLLSRLKETDVSLSKRGFDLLLVQYLLKLSTPALFIWTLTGWDKVLPLVNVGAICKHLWHLVLAACQPVSAAEPDGEILHCDWLFCSHFFSFFFFTSVTSTAPFASLN